MHCPRCRAENREGRRFCAKCGASFALAYPACFSNEPGEDFCGGCGKALTSAARPPAPRFTSPTPIPQAPRRIQNKRRGATPVDGAARLERDRRSLRLG
jgi:hypothetical protein